MEWFTYITTYTLIILAELGDKTQIATLILAGNNSRRRWVVFGAAACAFVACVMLEVTVGATVARILPQDSINLLTGVVFLVIGLLTLLRQYAQAKGWKMLFGILPKLTVEKDKATVDSEKA